MYTKQDIIRIQQLIGYITVVSAKMIKLNWNLLLLLLE